MIQIKRHNLDELADKHCMNLKDSVYDNLERYKIAIGLSRNLPSNIGCINEFDKIEELIHEEFYKKNNLKEIDKEKIEKLLKGNIKDLASFETLKERCIELLKSFNTKMTIKLLHKNTKKGKTSENKLTPLELLLEIFNYDDFVDKSKLYNAYSLVEALNVDTCPYCNRQYTHTLRYRGIKKDKKGEVNIDRVRPDLDHFISKSKHPYLALSFYNLIPSCQVCNSRLKLDVDFDFDKHLHPYTEGFGEKVKFKLKVNNTDFFHGKFKKEEASLYIDYGKPEFAKAKENAKVFELEKLYAFHLDNVFELVNKAMIYNDDYIDSLYKQFEGSLFRNREDVLRFVTANFIDDDDLHLRPLSKLTKDIVEQFDL